MEGASATESLPGHNGLADGSAIDAQLVLGGFPQITQEWRRGTGMWGFLDEQLSNPTSPRIVGGERILSAEFPEETGARKVLETIGSGERTFTTVQRRAGIYETTLQRALAVLVGQKRMVSAERPLSSRPSRETLYAVADPYLRFWLRFVGPNMAEIERGRGDLAVARIREGWFAYRGRAVETLVRESIFRMLPEERFGDAQYVGGYWTRKGDVEVDLIGAEEKARPRRVAFVGSIKWRERTPFGERDLGRIATRCPEWTKVPSWSASPEGDSTSKAEADIAEACHIRLASGVFMFRTCSEPPTKEET